METRKSSVLMMTAPAVGALLVGALLLGGMLPNTTDKFSEAMKPTGYVTVSVVRDGNEIYHSEQHNLITTAGMDFIAKQLGDTLGLGINGANYIALTTDSTAPAATDTTLTSEITTNGLTRTQGTYAHTAGTDNWTVSKTFTATGSFTGVQKAGLFTLAAVGTMMAENTFASVNLANGDQLTITWTIDLGLS
ncbi:MAG: hypothetical protein E6K88_07255 [Thaumarchaeota archaeon]|nr:MAG: hypothetical protein E6K88_07255 [Nitrososphaerota archaeon]